MTIILSKRGSHTKYLLFLSGQNNPPTNEEAPTLVLNCYGMGYSSTVCRPGKISRPWQNKKILNKPSFSPGFNFQVMNFCKKKSQTDMNTQFWFSHFFTKLEPWLCWKKYTGFLNCKNALLQISFTVLHYSVSISTWVPVCRFQERRHIGLSPGPC